MSVLYAYAQSIGAKVMCTNNLSEHILGDFTFYGDHAGSFAPLADFTATEVTQIGNYMGINPKFIPILDKDAKTFQLLLSFNLK